MSNKNKVLTCGSCSGLVRDKLISDHKCTDTGKLPSSKACMSHKSDIFTLLGDNKRVTLLEEFARSVSQLTVTEMAILASLLLGEKKTRRNGYRFWQKVYVRVAGTSSDNYFKNFAICRVLDADKELIRLVSESARTSISIVNDKNSDSIYTVEKFEPLRKWMVENSKFVDPREELRFKNKNSVFADLDLASKEGRLDNTYRRKNKKIKKLEKTSLVELVRRMSNGDILKRMHLGFDDDMSIR